MDLAAFAKDAARFIVNFTDAQTGTEVVDPFEGHTDYVISVQFSGSYGKTTCIWDAETGEAVAGPFEGHTDWAASVGFSPDGKWIVSGLGDRTIRIWNAENGE